MLTISYCGVGPDCDYVSKGKTEEEEIMKNGGEYAGRIIAINEKT
jgi:hypothetical protein